MTIEVPFHGYRKERGFVWPASDVDCAHVVFKEVETLRAAIAHCGRTDVVIQAGGNCGVFPRYLADIFGTVYTFEPNAANFVALTANTQSQKNVLRFQAALGCERGLVSIIEEKGNCGAGYVGHADATIPTLRIDDLEIAKCDLICLDIEGYEFMALHGAVQTIRRFRPVIMIEEKGLSEKYGIKKGEAEAWLAELFGYTVVDRLRRDVILVASENV